MKKTFKRHVQSLKYDEDFVYSYKNKAAKRHVDHLEELGYWNITTRKHVNYAAKELNLGVKHFKR